MSVAFTINVSAQSKTETFKVSGNCGMCKTNIENAAKVAGAEDATWNKETKELTVKYSNSVTNAAKIQQKVAEVGYDNAGFKSTDAAYSKLAPCCKYDRASAATDAETEKACCKKDGEKMTCDKEGHDGKDCCSKDGDKMSCSKEGHEGKDCCKKDGEKMDCCKDGKCTKEGHDGKDCCKKEGEKMVCAKDDKGGKGCCSKEGAKSDKH